MPNQLVRSPIFYIYKVTFESGATYRVLNLFVQYEQTSLS